MTSQQRALREAQQQIFNKLCAAFRRSQEKSRFRLLIENVRRELNLPVNIFTEALETFSDPAGKYIVIVIEQNGERYITLCESAKSNVSDWADPARGSVAVSAQRHLPAVGDLEKMESVTLQQLLKINHDLMKLCYWLNERRDLEVSSRLIRIVDEFNLLLADTATNTLQ